MFLGYELYFIFTRRSYLTDESKKTKKLHLLEDNKLIEILIP